MNPKDHESVLERAMIMIYLSKDKYNPEGLGNYQILAVYLAYISPRKCDETGKSKEIVNLKK